MRGYPIYLNIQGRRVLVVGAGSVATRKVIDLREAGAAVTVVAKEFSADFERICSDAEIVKMQRDYAPQLLEDVTLAIAATNDPELNTRIYNDCRAAKVLCNIVDVPDLCDFYVPAVLRRGDITIAISTGGKCPAYASKLRQKLEKLITAQHGEFLQALEAERLEVIEHVPAPRRKELLHLLACEQSFARFCDQGRDKWQRWAAEQIDSASKAEKLT